MKNLLNSFILYVIISGSFSSCVTLFTHEHATINIRSDKDAALIIDTANFKNIESTAPYSNLPATDTIYPIPTNGLNIEVARSKTFQLPVTIRNDSMRKTVYLKPRHSKAYYFNLLNYGVGFLADHYSPNRFAYPSKIYINATDPSDINYHRFAPPKNGDFTINLSVPYVNGFAFNDGKNSFSQGGFWGVTGGFSYYYTRNKFVSVQCGAAINLPLPFPAAIDYFGDTITQTRISSVFLNVKNNYTLGRFDFGYGLSIGHNSWGEFRCIKDGAQNTKTDTLRNYHNTNIGAAFSACYRLGRNILAGLLYQPYLFSLQSAPLLRYEHLISLEVIWRFHL